MSKETAVIIIPTYNEALMIRETLTQVFNAISGIVEFNVHVLVFDSASTDDTQAIVRAMQADNPTLHLCTEQHKTGLGSAYLQAMRWALSELKADIVIEFDADLSHQPHYLAPMLERIKSHDVVIGSRYVPGGSIPDDWAWYRKFLSVLGNRIARCILTSKYKDFTSGFRATRAIPLTRALPELFLSNHYAYKIELLWRLHQNQAHISEYPIIFVDRTSGESKLPTNSIFDSLRVLFTLRFQQLHQLIVK
jgi:dolichol-phosphate mannosyltransferase